MEHYSARPRGDVLARFLGIPPDILRCLFFPASHPSLLIRRRAAMIISRVRLVSALFAMLTPLWIVVDVLIFPAPVSALLPAGRVLTSVAFGVLAFSFKDSTRIRDAYLALALMFAIPTLFFIYSHPLLAYFQLHGLSASIAAGYAFLPFIMLVGLSVFPVTALEGAAFALPVLAVEGAVALLQVDKLNWSLHLGAFWLLALIAGASTLAGMSQLSFIITLARQAGHDPLTCCFTRLSGEELLEIQFLAAQRAGHPLAVVFLDIDNFKAINDQFGHEGGDRVLREAAASLERTLRREDSVVRWGGEEFMVIMPNATCAAAANSVGRLRTRGIGKRPDGMPLTASWGIAELQADGTADWKALVELADQRMYEAKHTGKDRVAGCGP